FSVYEALLVARWSSLDLKRAHNPKVADLALSRVERVWQQEALHPRPTDLRITGAPRALPAPEVQHGRSRLARYKPADGVAKPPRGWGAAPPARRLSNNTGGCAERSFGELSQVNPVRFTPGVPFCVAAPHTHSTTTPPPAPRGGCSFPPVRGPPPAARVRSRA